METIFFVGLVFSVLLVLFIFASPQNPKQNEQDKRSFSPVKKSRPLYNMNLGLNIADNGGTRLGIDRRRFHYTAYIPEKRSGMERRRGFDRRRSISRKESERRIVFKTQPLNQH